MTFEELLEKVRDEPRVVGLFLGGSRGKGAHVREDSDYDVRLIVSEDDPELIETFDTPRGTPVEVVVMTLDDFRGYALPGSGKEWDRYTFAHTTVLVDRLDGEIQRLVDEKGRLALDEAARHARLALDAYLNSLYRGLKRPGLGARIHAAESAGHLLATLFAIEGRLRPFHDYLAWELETYPLAGWPAGELLPRIDRVLSGDPEPQRELFRAVEPHLRAHGLSDVVDSWEPDVPFMRGEPA